MKLQIIKCSKPALMEVLPLVELYQKRLKAFVKIDNLVLKSSQKSQPTSLKDLASVSQEQSGVYRIVFDEFGKTMTTKELASKIEKLNLAGSYKVVQFLIGSPFGFEKEVKDSAQEMLRLSSMTLPSDLAWLICWEQLYRAYSILHNTGYHHE